eukprot:359190-Chlamydomonas_euryale.AAC.4
MGGLSCSSSYDSAKGKAMIQLKDGQQTRAWAWPRGWKSVACAHLAPACNDQRAARLEHADHLINVCLFLRGESAQAAAFSAAGEGGGGMRGAHDGALPM